MRAFLFRWEKINKKAQTEMSRLNRKGTGDSAGDEKTKERRDSYAAGFS